MREELVATLRSLADAEYQRNEWVNKAFPSGIEHDCFDYAVHFIYDDTSLAKNPERTIGLFLKDEKEVEMIKAVVVALERVFDALGMEATDKEYISSREWPDVLKAASEAWQAIKDDSN